MSGPWYTTAFGAHYPLLYQHRDEAEARQCLALLPRLAPLGKMGMILDLGCGDGRHLGLLEAAGHDVLGLDLSAHLLAAAVQRLAPGSPPFVRGDMRILPFASGSLGEVLSLFTAFGYFGVLSRNHMVVREVQRILRPGGHWFLDYVDCDRVRQQLGDCAAGYSRDRELGCLSIRETRRLVEDAQRVEKDVVLKPLVGRENEAGLLGVGPEGIQYTESVALFSVSELKEMAGNSGLTMVAGAGSYQGVPLGQGDRWIMVFKKIDTPNNQDSGASGEF